MASLTRFPAVAREEPFFLVGSERSGTTLLRLMLAHHAGIECAPEFEFLVEAMPDEAGWPALEPFYEWLGSNRIFLPHALEVDRGLDYPNLVRSFLEQYARRSKKPIHGATCHKHFDRLLRLWPRARFIHLVRDGRDVARSCIGMGWSGNVWHGAERWIAAEELWEALQPRLDATRRLELSYEDLIRAPEHELSRVCRFLGTEFDPGMLAYHEDSSYERPDPGLIAQWKRKLSPAELGLLEARLGPRLRRHGYEASGVPPTRVGPLRRLALWLDDRRARFFFRRRRYGLWLMLRSRLACLPGGAAWRRALLLERNEIDNRHLQ